MNKILRVVVALPAILFVVMGLRWVVAPAGIAPEFGMPLLQGLGLSTQIGDLGAFFFCGRGGSYRSVLVRSQPHAC